MKQSIHKERTHFTLLCLLGYGLTAWQMAQPVSAQNWPQPLQLEPQPELQQQQPAASAAPFAPPLAAPYAALFAAQPQVPGLQPEQPAQPTGAAAFQPGGSHHNKYPKFQQNFWKGGMPGQTGQTGAQPGQPQVGLPGQPGQPRMPAQLGQPGASQTGMTNFVAAGTVLSAILEDDLSSRTCKPGDVFSLTMQEGFVVAGRMAIAPHSKILGTVVNATPAKMQRHGHCGSLEVSLQSLVLPDGSHMPIYGFIEHNPNHLMKSAPKKRWAGVDMKDYGQSVAGMMGSMLSGPGWIQSRRQRGNEFMLEKDEVLPIRLTRGMTVPEVQVAAVGPAPNAVAPAAAPAMVPGMAPMLGPVTANPMNGLNGAPANGGAPGLVDSNEIFNTPLQPAPVNQLPDPF